MNDGKVIHVTLTVFSTWSTIDESISISHFNRGVRSNVERTIHQLQSLPHYSINSFPLNKKPLDKPHPFNTNTVGHVGCCSPCVYSQETARIIAQRKDCWGNSIKKEKKEAHKTRKLRLYGLYSIRIQLMSLGALRDLVLLLYVAIPSVLLLTILSSWLRMLSSSHTNSASVFSIFLLASILRYNWTSNEWNYNMTNWLPVKIYFRSIYKLPTRRGLDLSRSDCAKSTYAKTCASVDRIELDLIVFQLWLKR